MKNITKRLLIILLCLSLSVSSLAGCGWQKNNSDSGQTQNYTSEENTAFTEFADDLFRETVSSDTLTLHSYLQHPENYGITEYTKGLGRYNTENLDDTSDIVNCLTALDSFDRSQLSASQQITYDQLKKYLETELEYCDLYLFNTSLSTTVGIQVQLPIIYAEYAFNELKDIDEYLSIIEDTDEYFASLIDYETLRSENGYFMESSLAGQIIEQCRTFIDSANDGYLITTFEEKLDSFSELSEEEKNAYKERNKTAVSEHVIKGYEILADGLEKLKDTGKYSGGLCNYPNGQKYFEYLIDTEMGWDKTIEEYDELLDSYITKNLLTIQGLMRKDPTIADKFDSFGFSLTEPMEILSDLKQKIADDFPAGPDVNYDVKYITEALQDYASPAMYFTPQIDNISNNSIYINPGSGSGSDIYTTLAHEGFPGHLYQITYFADSEPDLIRYLIEPGGYVEGWATYCEAISYQYADTGNAALNSMMQANYAAIMCIYGKVDIGVNYFGWTENEVYSFISQYGFTDRSIASQMYMQMISEPANYCQYVLGYVGFMELKKAASEKLGDSFNLKNFHKFILDMGPVQFDILFERLDDLNKYQ